MNKEYFAAAIAPGRVAPLMNRHPWAYADSISLKGETPVAGDLVRVAAPDGTFLGWGLCSPASIIRVRMFSYDEELPSLPELFRSRLIAALDFRKSIVKSDTDSYRLVYGEGDCLPGLVVDRYGEYLAVTFTTAATAAHSELLIQLLVETVRPKGVVCIPDERMAALERFEHPVGTVWGAVPETIHAMENGVKYAVSLASSQRKMLYFDQRINRKTVAEHAHDSILDLYCYSGGFTLNALASPSVNNSCCVDSSAEALSAVEANVACNGYDKNVECKKGDALAVALGLRREGRSFSTVVVDPPKIVSDRKAFDRGIKKYCQINEIALGLVEKNGLYVTCSCSGLVQPQDFLRTISTASARAGRELVLLEMRGQAPDHPVIPSFPEGSYLKCGIFRVRK